MIQLKRNKRKFYLCKKIEDSIKFENPKVKVLNYEPVSSVGEMLTLGQEFAMYLKITCTPKEAEDFSDRDRCFIYKKLPTVFNDLCDDADYYVDGEPVITLNEAVINLKKLSGGQYENY